MALPRSSFGREVNLSKLIEKATEKLIEPTVFHSSREGHLHGLLSAPLDLLMLYFLE